MDMRSSAVNLACPQGFSGERVARHHRFYEHADLHVALPVERAALPAERGWNLFRCRQFLLVLRKKSGLQHPRRDVRWRMRMRGFAAYLLAGILAVLAMDFVALPGSSSVAVRTTPVAERSATTQIVDRTHKGDRLNPPTSVGVQQTQEPPAAAVMIGCDPPFSRLSARVNVPGRCVAELAHPVAG
jgi:hypothetical protein